MHGNPLVRPSLAQASQIRPAALRVVQPSPAQSCWPETALLSEAQTPLIPLPPYPSRSLHGMTVLGSSAHHSPHETDHPRTAHTSSIPPLPSVHHSLAKQTQMEAVLPHSVLMASTALTSVQTPRLARGRDEYKASTVSCFKRHADATIR